jgi:putative transcriptional regulator
MPIIVSLDAMLARRKMRSKQLAERVGITEQNVSLLKSGKVKGVRFDALASICEVLDCQPADILEFRADADDFRGDGQGPHGSYFCSPVSPPMTFDPVPLQPSAP